MNYGKLTAGTTKTAIDTAKPSEKGEIITYLSRMGDVLEQITDCGEAFAVSPVAVHTVIDGDKADIVARKNNIRILSNGQIVTPKAAEVFDQPTAHKTLLDKCNAFLHTGTVKVRPGITVIHQNFQVCIPMIMGISG